MKISMLPAVAFVVLLCTIPAAAQQAGELKIHIEYGGPDPGRTPIKPDKDTEFCGRTKLFDEALIVNPKNKGIQNVMVFVYTGRGGSKLDAVAPANKTHTLANDKCRFEPHIIIAQTGDTLKVTNPDAVGHNANLQFLMNVQKNFMIPGGQEKEVLLEHAEPGLISVDCNIHPWMKAKVLVLDHPYVAVSDENGDLTVKGLPTGKKLVFRVSHELGTFKGVKFSGGDEISRRNTFEVEIKPGTNDLGTIVMPAVEE